MLKAVVQILKFGLGLGVGMYLLMYLPVACDSASKPSGSFGSREHAPPRVSYSPRQPIPEATLVRPVDKVTVQIIKPQPLVAHGCAIVIASGPDVPEEDENALHTDVRPDLRTGTTISEACHPISPDTDRTPDGESGSDLRLNEIN